MFDSNKAIGYMRMCGYSVTEGAKKLGIPTRTMYRKLKTGLFTAPELEDMVNTFGIPSMDDLFRR